MVTKTTLTTSMSTAWPVNSALAPSRMRVASGRLGILLKKSWNFGTKKTSDAITTPAPTNSNTSGYMRLPMTRPRISACCSSNMAKRASTGSRNAPRSPARTIATCTVANMRGWRDIASARRSPADIASATSLQALASVRFDFPRPRSRNARSSGTPERSSSESRR